MMAATVDTVRNGTVRIAVLNVGGRREELPAREALGKWIPADADMGIVSMNGEFERARVAEWVTQLRDEDAEPLKDEHKLQIGEMELADRDLHAVIDEEVDTMLRNGVIEEGSGARFFIVVLVKKKDGSVRFCFDYRALNAVTVKDVYPLPRVDGILEALYGAQRFTSLDLHAGYWQLGVAEEDKPKTAFTTHPGLFQLKRMPFGLCNAPNYRLPFKLTTDASKTGLGAVLSQDQDSRDRPVAFASKVNSLLVAKYNISELECLAYRPGRDNHVADALSRGPVADTSAVEADADNDPVIGYPLPGVVAAEKSHRSEKDQVEHETAVIREVIAIDRDDGRVARDAYRPNMLAVSESSWT
ncbi:unnamed protein product [Phytophthora fragariaefolia]|uniref:Unnamed protein product n=1 Tax=Phytophthora fragariaefolia TaxID=1490495 RepID=A0A9W6Y838_9STRA|nr:unnamed protein product [Phytophthora fragariaefolia]